MGEDRQIISVQPDNVLEVIPERIDRQCIMKKHLQGSL